MQRVPDPNDIGLRLVILYKATKGAIWLTLAVVLGFGVRFGLADKLQSWIDKIHTNATHVWSIELTEALCRIITPGLLGKLAIAFTLDGTLTVIEGWALHRRRPWGEWLVVIATGLLVPIEVYEIIRKLSIVRISILLINVWIVAYLIRRIVRERAAKRESLLLGT